MTFSEIIHHYRNLNESSISHPSKNVISEAVIVTLERLKDVGPPTENRVRYVTLEMKPWKSNQQLSCCLHNKTNDHKVLRYESGN